MKCPSCSQHCSDLRDICPECKTDLRTHKKTLGVKISNPDLPVEQLLLQEMSAPSFVKKIKHFWGGKTEAMNRIQASNEKTFTTIIETDVTIGRIFPHDPPRSQDLPESDDAQEDLYSAEVASAERLDSICNALNEFPEVELPADFIPNINDMEDSTHTYTQQEGPSSVERLFAEACLSLKSSGNEISTELGFAQISAKVIDPAIEVLFDVAGRSIAIDGGSVTYMDPLSINKNITISSSKLESIINEAENMFNPSIGKIAPPSKTHQLKVGAADSAIIHPKTSSNNTMIMNRVFLGKTKSLVPSNLYISFLVTLIDGTLAIFLGFTLFVLIEVYPNSQWVSEILAGNVPGPLFQKLGFLYFCCLSSFLIYPCFFGACTKRPPAEALFRVKLIGRKGDIASVGQRLLRSLALPLSFCIGGFIPTLFGRSSIHDKIAGTLLMKTVMVTTKSNK